jgi:hypothetical protein
MKRIEVPDNAIDRIAFMQSQADETLPGYRYERSLTEEELDAEQRLFIDKSIELSNLEFEKAEAMAEFNRRIKEIKNVTTASIDILRTGRIEVVEDVYQIADIPEGKVYLYNQLGEPILSRPFTQAERKAYQRTVFSETYSKAV